LVTRRKFPLAFSIIEFKNRAQETEFAKIAVTPAEKEPDVDG
jgi:hypothetical protein